MAKEPTVPLRECPFCPAPHPHLAAGMENSARIVKIVPGESYFVECCVCGASISAQLSPERAAAAWNTRPSDPLRDAAPALFDVVRRWAAMWDRYTFPHGGAWPMVKEEHEDIRASAAAALEKARSTT